MSEPRPLPRYGHLASCCRHASAKADPNIRAGLEEAATVLQYIGDRPILARALAEFERVAPEALAVFLAFEQHNPKIADLRVFADEDA